MNAEEIDQLLSVLRKNGVSEFNQDEFGLRVKIGTPAYGPGPAEQLVTLQLQINQMLKEFSVPRVLVEDSLRAAPLEQSEPNAVEPVRMDLDDVLFGAK